MYAYLVFSSLILKPIYLRSVFSAGTICFMVWIFRVKKKTISASAQIFFGYVNISVLCSAL
jgi:hypothetical protein